MPYQKKNILNNTFENNELNEYKISCGGKLNKQFILGHNFIDEKKMNDYKKNIELNSLRQKIKQKIINLKMKSI